MASMRASETQEQTLERLKENRTRIASMRASETLPHVIIFVPHCQLILIEVQSSLSVEISSMRVGMQRVAL